MELAGKMKKGELNYLAIGIMIIVVITIFFFIMIIMGWWNPLKAATDVVKSLWHGL
jgi:hypothetical protein